jgi:prepilin-type N-terminal cleavage/methylation domain-containing protein
MRAYIRQNFQGLAYRSDAGFTLIELLVVIALIAILATSVMTLLNPVGEMQKALDSKRKSDLAQLQRTLELYYHDKGLYPPALNFGSPWQPYSPKLPNDPNPAKNYAYKSTGQTYYMYTSLDRGSKDKQTCNNGAVCLNAGGLSCGGVCNYGVSSSNVTP